LKNYYNIVSIILLVVVGLLILKQCDNPILNFKSLFIKNKTTTPSTGTVITKVETKWDTIKIDSLIYVPKWNTKIVRDTIPIDIDTLSILKEYYSKYFYTDTIKLDSFGFLVINDTISENTIIQRKSIPNIFIPTATIYRDSLISKNEYYLGLGVNASTGQLNYVGGEFLFRSKNRNVFGIGLGINQNLNPVIGGRIYWSIK
jgi:phenolic acid decarboxylase